MNTLSTDELKSLVEERVGPLISISSPTERVGSETRQNPIRFKKLLRDAEDRLTQGGLRAAQAQQMLDPARKLLDDAPFWQRQGDGLVVYLSPKLFRFYSTPFKLEELVVVGERFYVKPILRALTGNRQFYILALSQNKVRLLEATQSNAREMAVKDIPSSLAEALKYEQTEKNLQFRTVSGAGGRGTAMFYGQGASIEVYKERILRFCHQVDDGVRKRLVNQRAPLVFAGVDFLFPIYKEANTYAKLMPEPIVGNPDEIGSDELRKGAWAIVQPAFEKERHEASTYYQQVSNTPRAMHRISQVAPAAYRGHIELLFVETGVQLWGTFAPEVGAVHEFEQAQPGSEDMLDFAAAHTLLHGGKVYVVERDQMPNSTSVAAVLRF
jgi:Bacterial archaeo-eukaryotic release factor family 7